MTDTGGIEMLLSVVIPVYNEEAAIADVVGDVQSSLQKAGVLPFEVLVVDDGSKDRTAEAARAAGARVVRMGRNQGVGAARSRGVLKAKGRLIAMTDGDGSYPAESLPDLVKDLEECDMVVGARIEEMGTLKALRRPVKQMVKSLAEYMTGVKIKDLNSGLRIFRKKDVMQFLYLLPVTHSWVSTITLAYLSNGLDIRYRNIRYHKRVGRSTFHPVKDTYHTLSLMARTVMYFYPLRIFIPGAFLLFFVGILKSLHSYFFAVGRLQQTDIVILLTSVVVTAVGLLADLIVVHGRRLHIGRREDS